MLKVCFAARRTTGVYSAGKFAMVAMIAVTIRMRIQASVHSAILLVVHLFSPQL